MVAMSTKLQTIPYHDASELASPASCTFQIHPASRRQHAPPPPLSLRSPKRVIARSQRKGPLFPFRSPRSPRISCTCSCCAPTPTLPSQIPPRPRFVAPPTLAPYPSHVALPVAVEDAALSLHEAGLRVEHIIRELHGNAQFIAHRPRITPGAIWEVLRRASGLKVPTQPTSNSSPLCCAISFSPSRRRTTRRRFDNTDTNFTAYVLEYWNHSDLSLPLIALALQRSGFPDTREQHVLSTILRSGVRSGWALGAEGQKKLVAPRYYPTPTGFSIPPPWATLEKAFNLGMGVPTATVYMHEMGFGAVSGGQVERAFDWLIYDGVYL